MPSWSTKKCWTTLFSLSHTHTHTYALIYGFWTSSPRLLTNCLFFDLRQPRRRRMWNEPRQIFPRSRIYISFRFTRRSPFCSIHSVGSCGGYSRRLLFVVGYRCVCVFMYHIYERCGGASVRITVHAKKEGARKRMKENPIFKNHQHYHCRRLGVFFFFVLNL